MPWNLCKHHFFHQVQFSCIIPHTHFYLYILVFALALTLVYFLSTLYTLLWLCIGRMRKLSSHIIDYKRSVKRASKRNKWDKEKSEQVQFVPLITVLYPCVTLQSVMLKCVQF